MKFLQVFDPVQKGNFGLTDEAIYKSIQYGGEFIPIWGGNQEHNTIDRLVSINGKTKSNESITIFEGSGIIISLDGSAGCMTYKSSGQKFALNHHAGFFRIKDNPTMKVDLEFFSIFYQKQLQETSVSEGSKTLTLDQLYEVDFEIPDYNQQMKIMSIVRPILVLKNKINTLLDKINRIKDNILAETYHNFQAHDIPISQTLNYVGGNSGLTEEFLYSQIQTDKERKYLILTGSTDFTSKQYTHQCIHPKSSAKLITILENTPVIHVIRKGKAGNTRYFDAGNYTINDDAYLLYLKDSRYNVHLRWLMYQLKSEFLTYSSSSDNGTWNMTGFFKNVTIDIPIIDEQIKVVKEYEKLENMEKELIDVNNKIEDLLVKHIVN